MATLPCMKRVGDHHCRTDTDTATAKDPNNPTKCRFCNQKLPSWPDLPLCCSSRPCICENCNTTVSNRCEMQYLQTCLCIHQKRDNKKPNCNCDRAKHAQGCCYARAFTDKLAQSTFCMQPMVIKGSFASSKGSL